MVAVSVLVPVADDLEQVRQLVRSLDRQTLPSDEFEVVVAAGLDQLDTLAAHRPNLRVVDRADGSNDLLTAVDGDFVLSLGQDENLFPGSLARLREFAEQHGLDAVVARVVAPGVAAPAELWSDAEQLDGGAPVNGQLFLRRSAAELVDGTLRPSPVARVGVLGTHAVTRRSRVGDSEPSESGTVAADVTVDSISWSNGSLRLVLRTAGDPAPGRAVLQLTHGETAETFLLPAQISTTESETERRIEAAVAPTRTPAVGQPLAPGTWRLEVVLAADGSTEVTVPVPWSPCSPALIGGTAVVPAPAAAAGGSKTLTLDVGPMDRPLLTSLDPAAGVVTESVVGSELVLDLPELHTADTDGLPGHIALGKMRLPARLHVHDGRAQLVALVSGLAGHSPLSTQFGPGPLRPTGLSLQIDGRGAMSVIKTPPPAPKPAPAATPAPAAKPASPPKPAAKPKKRKKRKVEPPRTGLAADLRRAVPAPLEPVVKRLAAMPAARRLYRRVTR